MSMVVKRYYYLFGDYPVKDAMILEPGESIGIVLIASVFRLTINADKPVQLVDRFGKVIMESDKIDDVFQAYDYVLFVKAIDRTSMYIEAIGRNMLR